MKTRVLVVDDDQLVADTLSLIYRANGYECEARYSAAAAFECARKFMPALLLCDVAMPEEDGLQFTARLQQSMPNLRMLLLSAYSSSVAPLISSASQPGRPIKLLSKPCRPDDLLRESQVLLEGACG